MKVDIEFKGLKELQAKMTDIEKKQIPFALKNALNKTADEVKEAEARQMSVSFDRPTRWALNGMYIQYATKTNQSAVVKFKDDKDKKWGRGTPAANFIEPHVSGGKRNVKGFESSLRWAYVLPKGMYIAPGAACPLDAYGNIPHGLIMQILSYFKASERWAGHTSNITDKGRARLLKGTRKTRGFQYIISNGKGTKAFSRDKNGQDVWRPQHLPAGIYKKEVYTHGTRIRPIIMFVKEPSYQKRFPFYETAQKVIDRNLKDNFIKAMAEALKTAK